MHLWKELGRLKLKILKPCSAMKALFTKIIKSKIGGFFMEYWWLAILLTIFTAMWMWPPNFLNWNRVSGKIARTYEGELWVTVTQKGSAVTNALYIVLEDSSIYSTNGKNIIQEFRDKNYIGEKVELIYVKGQKQGERWIQKMVLEGKIIIDESKWLVAIFLFFAIWSILGVIGEVVQIWNATPVPKEKPRSIMVNKLIVQKEGPTFHRYTNCPACGYKLKETDKECPDCGLNLS